MSPNLFALKEDTSHGQVPAAAIVGMGHQITVVDTRKTRTMAESTEVAASALGAGALLLVEQYDDPILQTILSGFEKRLASAASGSHE